MRHPAPGHAVYVAAWRVEEEKASGKWVSGPPGLPSLGPGLDRLVPNDRMKRDIGDSTEARA